MNLSDTPNEQKEAGLSSLLFDMLYDIDKYRQNNGRVKLVRERLQQKNVNALTHI